MLTDSLKEPPDFGRLNGHGSTVKPLYEAYQVSGGPKIWEMLGPLIRTDRSLAALIFNSQPVTSGRKLRVISEEELSSLPPPEWLLASEGIFIPPTAQSMLVGPSGKGKSFVALHWALSLAQSGIRCMYIAAEKWRLNQLRAEAWYRYHHTFRTDGLTYMPEAVNFLDPTDVKALIETLRPFKPQLVVVDTLARCLHGDENSPRDMGMFNLSCGKIIHEIGTAILLVHHTGKNGVGARGHSSLTGACDCIIELKANGKNNIVLKNTKQSSDTEFPDVRYRLDNVDLEEDQRCCTVVLAQGQSLPESSTLVHLTTVQRRVLQVLAEAQCELAHTEIRNRSNLVKGTVSKVLDNFITQKLVIQDFDRGPYRITQTGKEAAQ
jgi:predicted ATP-dependent serine protease